MNDSYIVTWATASGAGTVGQFPTLADARHAASEHLGELGVLWTRIFNANTRQPVEVISRHDVDVNPMRLTDAEVSLWSGVTGGTAALILNAADMQAMAQTLAEQAEGGASYPPLGDGPAFPSSHVGVDFSCEYVNQLADAVTDRLVKRLAHPEALGLAEDAASVPGLDAAACSILADWLEDRQFADIAGKVRKLAVQPGDLLVLEVDDYLDPQQKRNLYTSAEPVIKRLSEGGRPVELLVVDRGIKLKHIPVGERKTS